MESDDSKTLNDIIHIANSMEAVEYQMTQFKDNTDNTQNIYAMNYSKTRQCFRCGSGNHNGQSQKCPAWNRSCDKCGYTGHFAAKCKTKTNKRSHTMRQSGPYTKHLKQENVQNVISDDIGPRDEYIFLFDIFNEIKCQLGGVPVNMVIDSGCRLNIIDDRTWKYLKLNRVKVYNQQRQTKWRFYG